MFKKGDLVRIESNGHAAKVYNYTAVVGKKAKVRSYQDGWAPYYRVEVIDPPDENHRVWCIQPCDIVPAIGNSNEDALGLLKEGGDPYE